jgi:hypothetical protein
MPLLKLETTVALSDENRKSLLVFSVSTAVKAALLALQLSLAGL